MFYIGLLLCLLSSSSTTSELTYPLNQRSDTDSEFQQLTKNIDAYIHTEVHHSLIAKLNHHDEPLDIKQHVTSIQKNLSRLHQKVSLFKSKLTPYHTSKIAQEKILSLLYTSMLHQYAYRQIANAPAPKAFNHYAKHQFNLEMKKMATPLMKKSQQAYIVFEQTCDALHMNTACAALVHK